MTSFSTPHSWQKAASCLIYFQCVDKFHQIKFTTWMRRHFWINFHVECWLHYFFASIQQVVSTLDSHEAEHDNCERKTLNRDLIIRLRYNLRDWCEIWWWFEKWQGKVLTLGFILWFDIFSLFQELFEDFWGRKTIGIIPSPSTNFFPATQKIEFHP